MWPWGHAAIGFLAYNLVTLLNRRRLVTSAEAATLVVGSQLPDLIDKPLAWSFAVLPSGRSLGHSIFTATVLVLLVTIAARRRGRPELAPAFGVGYLAGILLDLHTAVVSGDHSQATFLVWPLLPLPAYETEPSFGTHLATLEFTPSFLTQVFLFVVVFAIWFVLRDTRL